MWSYLATYWPWLVALVDLALALAVTAHAVLWKRDSRAVIAWVGLAWLAPFLGAFAYAVLGVNRIQRKAVALRLRKAWAGQRESQLTEEELEWRERFTRDHPNLIGLSMLGEKLSGRSVLPGNSIEPLTNGDEAYPAMIKAIGSARRSISLLSYIFDSDRAGEAILESLKSAHHRGVDVRVLIDDIGSKYSRPNMVRRLRKAGLKAASFLPTRLPRVPSYANMRNHRKILVVDGRIGFTGGTNIREGHWLSLAPRYPVQCLHFALR